MSIALVAVVLVGTVYVSPAAATDLAYGRTVAVFGAASSSTPNNATDGNDGTSANLTMAGQGNTGITWSLAAASRVTYWRVKFSTDQAPNEDHRVLLENSCGDQAQIGGTGGSVYHGYGVIFPGGSGSYSYDTGIVAVNVPGNTCVRADWDVAILPAKSGSTWHIFSVELYGAAPGVFTDYVYNLRAAHPSFARQYRWNWRKSWTGSYTFVDSGAHVLVTDTGGFIAGGDSGLVTIRCLPICGHDTYTINITDSAGPTASYVIDSDATGTLIPDVVAPVLTGATFCYQATTHQCAAIDTGSANTSVGGIWVRYAFTGDASTTYTVEACERALELLSPECWTYTTPTGGVNGGRMPGSYALTFMHNTARDTNQVTLSVSDSVGHQSFLVSGILPIVAGGSVVITPSAPVTDTKRVTCDQLDVVCGIGQLFQLAPGMILGGFGTIMSPLKAKQPFATIINSAPVILEQLGRASAAVTSTSTCSGVPIIVPLGVNGLPTAAPISGVAMPTPPRASASPMTVTVLDCATFESFVSQWSWFPTVRSFMDVAIYAAYGYSLLQRWQPRAQMNA